MRFLSIVSLSIAVFMAVQANSFVYAAEEQAHSVTGTVVREDEVPVQGALVTLLPGGYADTTDAAGRFRLNSVTARDYVLSVSMPFMGLANVRRSITVPYLNNESLKIIVQERAYRVDEVVVLSEREKVAEEIENAPSFVTVVERSDFENDAVSVADVLMDTPGTTINVMGGLGDYSEVSLRGAYSNQVQVYIDGMLLNEAAGGGVNLSTIPLTHVESVEVWRSGAPAHFGGNAMGGVVNITTRDMNQRRKIVSLGYGSFNTFTASTLLNIPAGMSRFHMTLDYSSSRNDFRYKSDNGTMYNDDDDYWARRDNDDFRSANLLSKYSRLFGNGMFLELSDHLLSGDKKIPASDNIRTAHASMQTAKNLFQAKLGMNPLFRNSIGIDPQVYHKYNREHYRDIHGSVGWGFQDNIYETKAFTALIPVTVTIGKLATFTITPTAVQESYRPEHKLQSTVPLSCDREQLALIGDGVFNTPGERLILTGKIRRDRYFSSYTGEPSPQNRVTPEPQFHHMTNVTAGAKIRVHKALSVQTSYGDITRIPGFYELFGDRGGTLSNPDLKPEHIYKWDAGFKIPVTGAELPVTGSIECAYFENNFKNLIQWYTNDAGFIAADNVSGSYVRGTELVWNSFVLNRFQCTGNWSFQRSKVTGEKRKYYRDKKLPNRPGNYGSVKVEYRFNNITPFWTMNRKSSYFLDRSNQDHNRYPGRTLHDTGVIISFLGGRTKCTALIKNITDVHTFDIQGMPKPGRSYMIKFVYTI